ncbi:hypothetical protein OHV05_00460 [Kitasatospora sp. NBC_00070]
MPSVFLGAAASTVLLPFAVLPALLWESGPYGGPRWCQWCGRG